VFETQADGIGEVAQIKQAAPVLHLSKRQRPAIFHRAHQAQKVGTHTGAIDQRWAQDHHFQPSRRLDFTQTLFRFPLGNRIFILWRGYIGLGIWQVPSLAIHLDRTDEDEPLYPGSCALTSQIQRALGVDGTKRGQRVGIRIPHDMYPRCKVDNRIAAPECLAPDRRWANITDHRFIRKSRSTPYSGYNRVAGGHQLPI